jgi:O-antigen ligase
VSAAGHADAVAAAAGAARPGALLAAAGVAALALPALVALRLPPDTTFFHQAAAFALWGLFVAAAALTRQTAPAPAHGRACAPLLAVCAGVGGFALAGWVGGTLPRGLALVPLAVLAAAALVALSAAAATPAAHRAVALGLVVAAAASALVALLQVFAPGWNAGGWIATSTLPGRAVGNLQQPNHLATLLLCGAAALVALLAPARLGRAAWFGAALLGALLIVALQLSGSRTGALGLGLLVLWGLLDARLPRAARALLLAAPLVYALAWAVAELGLGVGTAARAPQADPSSSRLAIWADALALVAAQPWSGVGYGQFNLAWTLSVLPQRPPAHFDHTHHLPLQWAVEFGLPAAAALLALLLWAALRAARRAGDRADAADAVLRRALLLMLAVFGLHSGVEYPLWYAHLLLPLAWAWGACLAPRAPAARPRRAGARTRLALALAGAAMVAAALAASADYLRVARIYTPPPLAAPLAQRLADGQASLLYAHHADYAVATTAAHPAQALPEIGRAARHLLDARLLWTWARAWAEAGDLDRARYLAARLREFRRPDAQAPFAVCDAAPAGPQPFQCLPPDPAAPALGWRDFAR